MTTYNNKLESEVRFYSRLFPDMFTKGEGAFLYNASGEKYLDFFCGSGSLNYGHNEPVMKAKIIEYITNNGILNSLDQLTGAKVDFMNNFSENILIPRNMEYKMQFCGPTGTNSVEAALKLARKYTKRERVLFFKDSFHGMTYGSMSVSGMKSSLINNDYTKNVVGIPFEDEDSDFHMLRELLKKSTKEEMPAAIILETLQAEGGMKTTSKEWLEKLEQLVKEHGILLIIDDIQAGCGRTGNFFSFEHATISPDIICLSKSLSGIGVPFSMNLIKPEIDCWKPGEHNGTFRGNNLAFIAGGEATKYWKTSEFGDAIREKANMIEGHILDNPVFENIKLKGKGLMRGLQLQNEHLTTKLQKRIFEHKILTDTCGPHNNVIKIMPPLNISMEDLQYGLHKISLLVSEMESLVEEKIK